MKKISLLTALMLTSSMVYAGWVAYDYNPETSTYTSVPQSSCLEMWCEGGCVEDADTDKGDAHCCPSGTNTANTGGEHPQYPLCNCPENQTWDTTTNGCRNMCLNDTPIWDATQLKCVECITDEDCTDNKVCNSEKKCVCNAGYYKKENQCIPCEIGTYKSYPGDDVCLLCSAYKENTTTLSTGSTDPVTQCVCRGGVQYTDDTECACATPMVDVGFKNSQFEVSGNKITWIDQTKGSIFLCITSYWDGNIVLNGANKQLNIPNCSFDTKNGIIKIINGASLTAKEVKAGFIEVENNSLLKVSDSIEAKCLFTRGKIDSGGTIKATGCAYADGLWMSENAEVKAKTSIEAISSRRNDSCSYYGILNWGGDIYSPSVSGKHTSISHHNMHNEGRIIRSY